MPKVSKNSKKGSSNKSVMMPVKKEKPKKTEIKIELTKETYLQFKEGKDMSEYIDTNGVSREVLRIQQWYGKTYLVIDNK